MTVGHIYIMSNKEIPHLLKIGHTTRSVNSRAKELSAGAGVPGHWIAQKTWLVSDSYRYEQIVHKTLTRYRRGGVELYQLDIQEAVEKVSVILRNNGAIDDDGLSKTSKILAEIERNASEIQVIESEIKHIENNKIDISKRRDLLARRLVSTKHELEVHSKSSHNHVSLIDLLWSIPGLAIIWIVPGLFYYFMALIVLGLLFNIYEYIWGDAKKEKELLSNVEDIEFEIKTADNELNNIQTFNKLKIECKINRS